MKNSLLIACCAVGLASAPAPVSASPTSSTLLKTRTTWNGAGIAYSPARCPEVDAVVVEIPAGEATPVHLHPVNNYAYVLSGAVHLEELEVVKGELVVKSTRDFKQGEAFAELVNTWHRGTAGPGGVKILVWYTARAGRPFTVGYSPGTRVERDAEDDSACTQDASSRKGDSPGAPARP